MLLRFALATALLIAGAMEASARQITVATWNLGWHMDTDTAGQWIAECGKKFAKDASGDTWSPATGTDGTLGWELDAYKINGWDHSRFPVCGVYYDGGTLQVTLPSYQDRLKRVSQYIENSLKADVLAFQEVSGIQAVKEILPGNGADYEFCGLEQPETYKVQRLVIAWKRTLGTKVSCETEEPLSLRGNPERYQPRPGLAVTLKIDNKLLRVLTVHLKSSCVSPFDGGKLESGGDDCKVLQQQIDPIESWIERATADDAKVIMLGDFNRNLWHELRDQSLVRTDASPASEARPAGALSRSLLEEIADGKPGSSQMTMVSEECLTSEIGRIVCEYSETRPLRPGERSLLGSGDYLGCRNPVGLDHILVGPAFDARKLVAKHISVGYEGSTKANRNDPARHKLAISDHCPMALEVPF